MQLYQFEKNFSQMGKEFGKMQDGEEVGDKLPDYYRSTRDGKGKVFIGSQVCWDSAV